MATIPEALPTGRPSTDANRMISADRSGEILAGGTAAIGDALSTIGQQAMERTDKFQYASAKASLLSSDLKSRQELAEDPDYETWEQRHRDTLTDALSEALGTIRNNNDRKIFELESKLDIERGVSEIRKLAIVKEVGVGRAKLDEDLAELNRLGMEAEDPSTRRQIVATANDLLAGASVATDERPELITPEERVNMQQAWTEDYARGAVLLYEPSDRAQILANPEGTEAEFIPADERKVMLRQAQSENKQTRIRAKSVTHTDRIMTKFNTVQGRPAALREVSKIRNADEQVATRQMVNARFAEMQQIDTQQHDDVVDRTANLIEDGGRIEDIDPRDWKDLSKSERAATEARFRQVQTGAEPIHNDEKYYEWTQLTQTEQLKTKLLATYRPYLDNQHYERAVAWQQALSSAQQGGKDGLSSVNQGLTQNQLIENALVLTPLFKKKPTSGTSGAIRARWARIASHIDNTIIMESQSKNRKLTPTEMRNIVNEETVKFAFTTIGAPDPEKHLINMTPAERDAAYIQYDDIDADDLTAMKNYASSVNRVPSEQTLSRAAAAWMFGDRQRAMWIIENED